MSLTKTPQSYPVLFKIVRVIRSCNTPEQLAVAERMVERITDDCQRSLLVEPLQKQYELLGVSDEIS